MWLYYIQNYEAKIDALQKKVEEQSMNLSMYSSMASEDFLAAAQAAATRSMISDSSSIITDNIFGK